MQWGAWAIIGMASHNANVLARIERSGMGVIQPLQGLNVLHIALTIGLDPAVIVNPFRWYDMGWAQKGISTIFMEQIPHILPQVSCSFVRMSWALNQHIKE